MRSHSIDKSNFLRVSFSKKNTHKEQNEMGKFKTSLKSKLSFLNFDEEKEDVIMRRPRTSSQGSDADVKSNNNKSFRS